MKPRAKRPAMWLTMMILAVVRAELVSQTEAPESTQEVRLRQGVILARREDAGQGRYFYSLRGIPFAKPPVGDLRFRDPVPHGAWSGQRDGSIAPPLCPQLSIQAGLKGKLEIVGEEDCLYLNVFTPTLRATAALPVMVWIHGGAFTSGGSENHDPSPLLTKEVVIVVVQYRLGTLGFLSTEDSVMPGNLGLKDQTLALRWVQENIRDLGGDPAKVTLFGVSAGGASAHYQMLTPKAEGLFSRAILQSGTALCPWALREDHRQVAFRIGDHFNCSDVNPSSTYLNTTQLLACLQEAPLHDIVLSPAIFCVWNTFPWVMAPRVDGDFIPDHPATLVRSGRYSKVDLIIGFTRDEGSVYASVVLANETSVEQLERNFSEAGPLAMIYESWDDSPLYLARRTFYRYLGQGNITEDKAEELTQMISDRYFKVCAEDAALFHTSAGAPLGRKVFRYELRHRGQNSWADLFNLTFSRSLVSHGDDEQYLFKTMPVIDLTLDHPADLFVREVLVALWTNFAASGNPTPDGSLGFRWWPTTEARQWYLALTTSPTMKDDAPVEVLEFWRNMPTKKNKLLYPDRFLENGTCPVDGLCGDQQ